MQGYMHEVLAALLWVIWAVFAFSLCGFFWIWGKNFALRLRDLHNSVWVQLDSPVVDDMGSSKAKLIPYLSRRGYQALGDEELNKLGDRARAMLYMSIAAFVMMLVGVIVVTFLSGDR